MKNSFVALILTAFILIASSGISSAADIVVNHGESIQVAVDNATSGDRILVQPGTYNGDVTVEEKSLTLSGNENTIINGRLSTDLSADVVVNGFTFKGAESDVFVSCSNCAVKNCKFVNCNTGIIAHDNGYVTVTNDQFTKCNMGIESLPFSSIVAKNNKFVDCDTAISDPATEATIDAKDNVITKSGESNNTDTTPTPKDNSSKVTPAKSKDNTTNAEPSAASDKSVTEHSSSNIQVKEVVKDISNNKNVTISLTNNTTNAKSVNLTLGELLRKIWRIINNLNLSKMHLSIKY